MGFSRQEYWSGLPFPSQVIFLTQELNLGLLNCRQTLYQLSYEGSPLKSPLVQALSLIAILSSYIPINLTHWPLHL